MMAMRRFGKEPFPVIYQDSKADSDAAKAGQLPILLQTVDKPNKFTDELYSRPGSQIPAEVNKWSLSF